MARKTVDVSELLSYWSDQCGMDLPFEFDQRGNIGLNDRLLRQLLERTPQVKPSERLAVHRAFRGFVAVVGRML